MTQISDDETFMKRAIELALAAAALGEVPVGAVLVGPDGIVSEAANRRESAADPLGHAEILAIADASRKLGRWRLSDCTLYVTLEPCVMCAGAIVQSRIGRVVYGAVDRKAGAVESLYQILGDARLNHRPQITSGVSAAACGEMLTDFFQKKRAQKKDES